MKVLLVITVYCLFAIQVSAQQIQKQIINELSKKILGGDVDRSSPVIVDVFDGTVVFRNEKAALKD